MLPSGFHLTPWWHEGAVASIRMRAAAARSPKISLGSFAIPERPAREAGRLQRRNGKGVAIAPEVGTPEVEYHWNVTPMPNEKRKRAAAARLPSSRHPSLTKRQALILGGLVVIAIADVVNHVAPTHQREDRASASSRTT